MIQVANFVKKWCIFLCPLLFFFQGGGLRAADDCTVGIIGGQDSGLSPYAALVSPTGTTTALTGPALPVTPGSIHSVAINSLGNGIIGGRSASINPYAALVAPSGMTTTLSGLAVPTGNGEIRSVAINSLGSGIIGGQDSTGSNPYGALVSLTYQGEFGTKLQSNTLALEVGQRF